MTDVEDDAGLLRNDFVLSEGFQEFQKSEIHHIIMLFVVAAEIRILARILPDGNLSPSVNTIPYKAILVLTVMKSK